MDTTIGSVSDRKTQGFGMPECAGVSQSAPAAPADETCITKRKPGRPPKRAPSPHSSSSWQASDPQPAPKRGRGRPRIHPLQDTIEVRARQKRPGGPDGKMPARNAARARLSTRQPRSLSDPYKVLRLNHCETDAAVIRAAYTTAQMGCSDMLPGPLQLSEDPDSAGHQRLMMVSDALMILEDRRMKTLLDKCLNHHYEKQTGSAVDILDIPINSLRSRPTEQEVEQAYNDRMAEWSGLEKVAEVVIRMLKAARETVLRDLKQTREEQKKPSRQPDQQRHDSVMSEADSLLDELGQ